MKNQVNYTKCTKKNNHNGDLRDVPNKSPPLFFYLPHKISNHLSTQKLSATSPHRKLMTLPFFSQIKWLNKTLLFPPKGFTLCLFFSLLSFIKMPPEAAANSLSLWTTLEAKLALFSPFSHQSRLPTVIFSFLLQQPSLQPRMANLSDRKSVV